MVICIVSGTVLGYFFPSLSTYLSNIEFANVSLPIAIVTFDDDVSDYAQGKIFRTVEL